MLAAADLSAGSKGVSGYENFAAAVGAIVIEEESLSDAAEQRDIEAVAVAKTLTQYRLSEHWEVNL